jgi:hypothetical protein
MVRAALVLGLLAALAGGCKLFQPAKPEVGGGGSTLLTDYSSPDSCLEYMRLGIQLKGNVGQAAYIGALADSSKDGVGFHALFDPAVVSAYQATGGTPPADWGVREEADRFYPTFIGVSPDSFELLWEGDEFHPNDDLGQDAALLHRQYVVRTRRASQVVDTIAIGYADLSFARISASRWALIRWEDRVDSRVGVRPANPLQQSIGSRRLRAY